MVPAVVGHLVLCADLPRDFMFPERPGIPALPAAAVGAMRAVAHQGASALMLDGCLAARALRTDALAAGWRSIQAPHRLLYQLSMAVPGTPGHAPLWRIVQAQLPGLLVAHVLGPMQDLEPRQQGCMQLRMLQPGIAAAAAQVPVRDIWRDKPGSQLRLQAAGMCMTAALEHEARRGPRNVLVTDGTDSRKQISRYCSTSLTGHDSQKSIVSEAKAQGHEYAA